MKLALLVLAVCATAAFADPIPSGWQASGLRPIGYTDLNGRRGGIKLAIRKVGERWVLYKAQRQEVLQDTRGFLYVLDSGWGIWILRDEIKR